MATTVRAVPANGLDKDDTLAWAQEVSARFSELADATFGRKSGSIVVTAVGVAASVANGVNGFLVTSDLNGLNILTAEVGCETKGITGSMTIQLRRVRAGASADVLSTLITVGDAYIATSTDVNTSNDDLATGDLLYADVDTIHTTPAEGVTVGFTAGA